MKVPAVEKMSCSGEQRRRLPPASIRRRKRPSCLIAQAQAFPLALNPTQKAAVLSFMVNEQLQNKAVIGQIDGAIERQNTTRRDRWIVDSKIKKLKFLHSEETPQFVRLIDEFDGRQSRSHGKHTTRRTIRPAEATKRRRKRRPKRKSIRKKRASKRMTAPSHRSRRRGKFISLFFLVNIFTLF